MKGAALLVGMPPAGPAAPAGGDKKAVVDQACKDFMAHPSCDTLSAMMDLHRDYETGMSEGAEAQEE